MAECLERETGFEPATLALARRCSTTELLPLKYLLSISAGGWRVNSTRRCSYPFLILTPLSILM